MSLYCLSPAWLVDLFLFISIQFWLRHSLISLRISGCILFFIFMIEAFFPNWIYVNSSYPVIPTKALMKWLIAVVAYHLSLIYSKSVFLYVFPWYCLITTTKGSRYFGIRLQYNFTTYIILNFLIYPTI